MRVLFAYGLGLALWLTPACNASAQSPGHETSAAQLADNSSGRDWPAFGRTFGEQHYSPLSQIDAANVSRLGLAWSMDLGRGNSSTVPLAVNGILYFASGLSVVHAVAATTGKLLWIYDPEVAKVAGHRLQGGWGSRGIAYWNGKIYTGTIDGRLIAVDTRTGKPVWSATTYQKEELRYITGPPRVFDGKVIVGHGGADWASIRGYVTTYDAETGKQLWRFHTVPGNPADGFEDKAMEMAAKTWSGEWWKYGGGGTVWNAITYDAALDTIYLGTGNGAPWNHRVRSEGKGDNLFLCSIVALDAKTGAYKWHYQINPGETWDYNAAMDMELAELPLEGGTRKVLMTAPKNGFFYVLDRMTGKLISAQPIAKVTWASRIDSDTGRPVEVPAARFPNGSSFEMWPSDIGAHSWQPMSFSPKSGLVYIPVIQAGALYRDSVNHYGNWKRVENGGWDSAVSVSMDVKDPLQGTSYLLAWDPVARKAAWKVNTPKAFDSGTAATAGNLVFQGDVTGAFNAYAADSGQLLWSFPAQAPISSAPITYEAKGRQYVTILVGFGTSATVFAKLLNLRSVDYYTQAKRVLTFTLDSKGQLPPAEKWTATGLADPSFTPDDALAQRGAETYGRRCLQCHGIDAVSGGAAPDLRASAVPQSAEAFTSVVREGARLSNGMPRFDYLDDAQLSELRQYLRTEARKLRAAQGKP